MSIFSHDWFRDSFREFLSRSGVAALAVCVSGAAALLISPLLGVESWHPLMLAAVIFSAWYGGEWVGVAATCLVAVAFNFVHPAALRLNLSNDTFARNLHPLLFLLEGGMVSALGGGLRATGRRAARDSEQARLYRESSQQSEASLKIVIESVHDHAIFMIDAGGRVVSWDKGAERLLGYTSAEIVGQNFSRCYTPEDAARGVPEKELRIARSEGRAAERRWHMRRDGSRFWGDGVLKAMRDADGRLRGFSRLVRDTTERWQTEEALRQSEERFRIVARATNDAVWDWHLQTNKVWWNDSVTHLFGYSREEVTCDAAANGGATWWYQHIHADDRDRVVASIYATITNREQEWSAEYRFERRDGAHSDIHDRGFVVYDEQHNPVRMIGSMMDITERKRAEQERAALLAREQEARSEAEKANRVKDEFLAMVSHELRTPLTTIKMMTRLMQREVVSAAERHECLESISNACDRETDLVLNLLDVSRAEAGALHLEFAPVDVNEMLAACVNIEAHAAAARGHELLIESSPTRLLPPLRADRKALRRVLCNLIENAIKYTPAGGTITLCARTDDTTDADAVREIVISVSDTGRGIAPAELPRLFEKFYRGGGASHSAQSDAIAGGDARAAGAVVEPETPGVGLGLYLSQAIVVQFGGSLSVESVPGAGSTFTVRLPVWSNDATDSMVNHSSAGRSMAHNSNAGQGEAHEEASLSG